MATTRKIIKIPAGMASSKDISLFLTQAKYTMINGRLYDAATMNEIGNYDNKRTQFFFEQEGNRNGYEYFQETNSFMVPVCCQKN